MLMKRYHRAVAAALAIYVVLTLTIWFGLSGQNLSMLRETKLKAEQLRVTTESDRVRKLPNLSKHFPRKVRNLQCLGWRPTKDCNPHSERVLDLNESCSLPIQFGMAGFCEVMDVTSKEKFRIMETFCATIKVNTSLTCSEMVEFGNFAPKAEKFIDKVNSPGYSLPNLVRKNAKPGGDNAVDAPVHGNSPLQLVNKDSTGAFDRGIVMVVYPKMLASAYATIRVLRSLKCKLPLEIWYRSDEMAADHAILQQILKKYGPAQIREVMDPQAKGFYSKIYSVYHSQFTNLLFLDADNVPIRDPTYLFDTSEFTENGAVFWPDFWSVRQHIFNIHKEALLWQYIGTPFVDMFEQESAQLLINRAKHAKALEMLHFYAFYRPNFFEDKQFVYGDKDLYRLAWMASNSSFVMIPQPPSFAGTAKKDNGKFCGVTMVQHDPRGEVVFLHRNAFKLKGKKDEMDVKCWTHLMLFRFPEEKAERYAIQATPATEFFPDVEWCYGPAENVRDLFDLVPMDPLTFAHIEDDLIQYAHESAWLDTINQPHN